MRKSVNKCRLDARYHDRAPTQSSSCISKIRKTTTFLYTENRKQNVTELTDLSTMMLDVNCGLREMDKIAIRVSKNSKSSVGMNRTLCHE